MVASCGWEIVYSTTSTCGTTEFPRFLLQALKN